MQAATEPAEQQRAHGGSGAIGWKLDPLTRCFVRAGALMRLLGCDDGTGRLRVERFYKIVCFPERERVRSLMEAALAENGALSMSFRIVKPDGAGAAIAMSGGPQGSPGWRRNGIALEIGHAVNAELDELRQADRSKNEFIAMMAHELRNPLAAILGAGELVERTAPAGTSMATAGATLKRQTLHLSRLIDELRNIAYTGLARTVPGMCACPFDEIVRDATEQVAPRITARAHRFVIESPGARQLVSGNFTQLVQIVANLLNNASKYTPDGGTICLTVESEGERLRCTISDSGIGMAPEFIGHAFEPFVQAEAGRTRSEGGIGLGLKLVRELAAINGGIVHAHSDGAGCGSTFILELPLLAAAPGYADAVD